MCQRFLRYAPVLLYVVTLAAGCGRTNGSPTSPTPSVQPTASMTAEPVAVRPDFLPTPVCLTRPAFGIRLSIRISGGEGLILRGLQLAFTDRFGGRALPEGFPIPTATAASFPPASPIPIPGAAALPGTSPIPIPNGPPVHGVFVPPGSSRTLPFFVRFDCGVIPDGTLLVTADAGDSNGQFQLSQMKIRVGN